MYNKYFGITLATMLISAVVAFGLFNTVEAQGCTSPNPNSAKCFTPGQQGYEPPGHAPIPGMTAPGPLKQR
jgi:hypothetical protein